MKLFRDGLRARMLLGSAAMLLVAVSAVSVVIAVRHRGPETSEHSEPAPHRPAPSLQIPRAAPSPSDPFSPPIRVNVTPDPRKSLTLAVDRPYRIRPLGSSRILDRGRRMKPAQATVTATGFLIGEREFPVARLEIEADDPPAIWVGDHQYRGRVRLIRRPGRRFMAVNVLPLEEYIAGVVDSEMPAAFPTAARKAQAIVARTFALYQMTHAPKNAEFDLYATTRSQKYLGFQYRNPQGRRLAGESADSRRITQETAGMVCLWRGELFCTYYSAVCGGRTTPGRQVFSDAAPPLQSVACDWCRDAPRYRWIKTLPKSDVAAQLKSSSAFSREFFAKNLSMTRVSGPPYSRHSIFEVRTQKTGLPLNGGRRQRLSAVELRRSLSTASLPSPRFTVRDAGESLEFHGRGHGHGVGLCQWGARGLALAGRDELQILRYYYPGAELVVLESDIESGSPEQ